MNEPSGTFICPITHELIVDPVIDPDGNSYERHAIEDWLRQNGTSPITRTHLSAADLRPNRALKTAIDEYRQSLTPNDQLNRASRGVAWGCKTGTRAHPYEKKCREGSRALNNDPQGRQVFPLVGTVTRNRLATVLRASQMEVTSSELTVLGNYAEGFVHISIQPPADTTRSPCDICCVVDTSGSMAVQAEIQNAANEKFGLSQLDLVKHALKTIIHSLLPQDRLALVSFANSATVLFQLTKMTEDGKSSALATLERLEDNGNTNLWDGLRAGLEVLAKDQRANGSNSALYLLTDGCPNIEPPLGHLRALKKLRRKSNFTCSINTFGFGYDLDSKLLEDISILGNAGSYAFIPDGSFVGTIFVNAITTLLTTVATNVQVCVNGQRIKISDYTRWYSTRITGQGTVFELGSITYGQSKDLLIPLSPELLSECEFSVIYDTLQEKRKSVKININTKPEQAELRLINEHKFRLQFVHCVRTVLETMRQRIDTAKTANKRSTTAMNRLKELEDEMRHYADNNDAFVKDLLGDLTGQVQEAITREDWFKKWGVHFLPSLTRAHLLQYCNNFKDPGVQNYGRGVLFSTVRDEMDTIFCSLPAPKASVQTGAPINMSVFNNPSGGCFYGGCTVRLMNGTTKLIQNVIPGDRMAPHGGMVNYVIKTICKNEKIKMVALDNGLIITAWHPIRFEQQWIMPCSLVSAPIDISCKEVYNFALDQGHTVLVNDVECITLGHGFKEDVVRHAYYGTQRVIEDLHRLDCEQNNAGIIELAEEILIRNKQSGLVSGLRPFDGQHRQQILIQ